MIVVAHRGLSGSAPENTMAAFTRAVEVGANWIELDVRLTRDGVPVCFHDETLDRVTPERGPLAERNWADLARLTVMGSGRIPQLSDVLAALPRETQIAVELKPDSVRPDVLVRWTLEAVASAGAVGRVRFISFDPELLRRIREISSTAALGVLCGADGREESIGRALRLEAKSIHIEASGLNETWIAQVHARGLLVNAWTINDESSWERLRRAGVDELTTDFADRAIRFLDHQT